MHPLLSDRRSLGLYVALWAPVGLLLTAAFVLTRGAPWGEAVALVVPLTLIFAFQCLSAWYVARALPSSASGLARLFASGGAAAIVASLLWLVFGLGWATLLARFPTFAEVGGRYRAAVALFFVAGVLLYLLALLGALLLATFERSRAAERRALRLQVTTREAELKALKSQLDPHFLFNSLNSVSALIGSDPAAARRMCLLLAGFFRKSLGLGSRAEISLAEELYLAETYLAIEEVRFGPRLAVATEIAEETLALAVPPLLLQPLVENAVHHGIAQLLDGGEIRLTARRTGDRLELSVSNPCDPERPPSRGAGVGLANVRSRLAALFGDAAQLEIAAQPTAFSVRLRLPARPSPGTT